VVCVCVCVCDETKLMTELFSYMAVGYLRDCEFVVILLSFGDLFALLKIMLIRFEVCTYMHYIHYIYVYVIHPSVALQPLLGPVLPQKTPPFVCLLLVHTHTYTHRQTQL